MKKIALAAFSASALLGLSACGDAADEPVVEETTIEAPAVEPVVEETTVVEEGDTMAEEAPVEEAPAE